MSTPATVPDDLAALALVPIPEWNEAREDVGESSPHFFSNAMLALTLATHLAGRPQFRVFGDMNLYCFPSDPDRGLSPDVMVVTPSHDLGFNVTSYRLPGDGPPPVLVIEVLSERTARQRDLGEKIPIYAQLGVAEYVLLDPLGRWLPQQLLLKRLQPDGAYRDERDADGGVTSALGFRLMLAEDGWPDVYNSATGRRYARPTQAEQEAEARRLAEQQQRHEAELRRQAEELQRQAEEGRRQEAEARRQAEEKQRLAEANQRHADRKRRRAEKQQRQDAEARRQAEEQVKAFQAEIERLRQAGAQPPPTEGEPQP